MPQDIATLIKNGDTDGVIDLIVSKIPSFLTALVIIIIGFLVAEIVGKVAVKAMQLKGVDSSVHNFIRTIISLVIKLIFIISALSAVGFNINTFVAALGAAGVTAGLGLQQSISQFASGIEILINKPFKSGDYIELENVSGKVIEIKLMYTILVTLDNKRVIVPNSHIVTNTLINYTSEKKRRIDLEYSISYSQDIEKARRVLSEVAEKSELVLKSPAPIIAVKEHGDSSIIVTCYVWCNSSDYWEVFFDMQEKVKVAFDKQGIEIPYKQIDIHVSKENQI